MRTVLVRVQPPQPNDFDVVAVCRGVISMFTTTFNRGEFVCLKLVAGLTCLSS